MSTLKVTNLQHPSAASANVTLDSSGNAAFSGGITGVTSVNGGQLGGFKNRIINGGLTVWQRGTSVTGASSSGYSTADRWQHNASGGSLDLSQQTLTVGQTDIPSQFKYFMRVACTTGNNNAGMWQKIEDVTSVQGTVTVSFYAKGTNPNGGSFELNIRQNFGSSGSTEVDQNETFTVTSSWQRFTFTIQMQDISGKTISGGNDYVWLYFRQPDTDTSTNAWTLDFTGVQLETGSTASDFEFEDYGTTLQKCLRYFCTTRSTTASIMMGSPGIVAPSLANRVYRVAYPLPVRMRAAPSATIVGTMKVWDASNSANYSSAAAVYANDQRWEVDAILASDLADGRPAYFYQLTTSDYINFDAEL